ncbi:MAG: hypothetical protein PHF23_08125 [Smithellaceae bacterium]|jgi:hypothetical protein|nr:hypothetical protein [Smithellaceae bacterium]
MTLYIGFDDTDILGADTGTGKPARNFEGLIPASCRVLGVVRQQLLTDPAIPYTSHNSSACIILDDADPALEDLLLRLAIEHLERSALPAIVQKIAADLIGARRCIFVKDERGLYTDDPKKKSRAAFIPEISVKELTARDLNDLIIERPCLEILQNSEVVRTIQIINGLEKGNLTKALNGKPVGTIIHQS